MDSISFFVIGNASAIQFDESKGEIELIVKCFFLPFFSTQEKMSLVPALSANFRNSGTVLSNESPNLTGCSISPSLLMSSSTSFLLNISKCLFNSSSLGMVTNRSRSALALSCSFLIDLKICDIFFNCLSSSRFVSEEEGVSESNLRLV